MPLTENSATATELRNEQIEKYWAGDLARRSYLYRRQRKAILENCRRIAVVGASADPNSPIFIAIEKILGMGLEIIPCFQAEEPPGARCFAISEVPGKLDIVQVYPSDNIDFADLAREAWLRASILLDGAGTGGVARVEEILVNGRVQLVEYENLETEYLKHLPFTTATTPSRKDRKATRVRGE
jgi:hypothetical protein